MINCTIAGSADDGIDLVRSTAQIINCTISDNSRGVLSSHSKLWLEGCIITGNTTRGIHSSTLSGAEGVDENCLEFSPSLTNCLIVGNGAEGVYCYRTTADLVNCTVADNRGPEIKQIRHHYTPLYGQEPYEDCTRYPKLVSCAVQGATPLQAVVEYYEEFEDDPDNYYELVRTETRPMGEGFDVTYSCVQGGWPDTGNIDTNPLFVDPGSGDYHLQPGSPCIDSASTTGPDLDLDGHLRPVDIPGVGRDGSGAYDMGAYEFGSVPRTPTPTMTPTSTLSPAPTDTPGLATATPTALPSATPIPGDLNSDGTVNHNDLLLFQEHWHKSVTPIPGP